MSDRRGWVEPCVMSPRGNPSNHHSDQDGNIGARVSLEDATHFIVVAKGSVGLLVDLVPRTWP